MSNPNVVRVAQHLSPELDLNKRLFIPSLMPGDFYSRAGRNVFGPTMTVMMKSQKTVYFHSSEDMSKLDLLSFDMLPDPVKVFEFTQKTNSYCMTDGSKFTQHREYEFHFLGKRRIMRMFVSLSSECVRVLDNQIVTQVHFKTVRKHNRQTSYWTIDAEVLS